MRLADFILANTESILSEWDLFVRRVWPRVDASPEDLRDHAEAILISMARDMQSLQNEAQRSEKSKDASLTPHIDLTNASEDHATGRALSGFELKSVMAEYRALRASVVRLWIESIPAPDAHDVDDLTRFHEAMDESLAQAVHRYSEHVDRSRRMFLRILGHDVRTPLSAISVSAEWIAATRREDRACAEVSSQIKSSADAIARMLSDFLDFSVSRPGRKMPVSPVSMDLAPLCREVIAENRTNAPGRSWQVEIEGDLRGKWDQGRLRQLLSNLIGNAVQHGAANSPIGVSARSDGAFVTVTVRNAGSPIPAEDLPRIFDPLVRGKNSAARTGQPGTGFVYRAGGGPRARRGGSSRIVRRRRNNLPGFSPQQCTAPAE